MKKQLNEGLMDAIMRGIMTWAVKKDINNDPEFRKKITGYQSQIASLSKAIEDDIKELEKTVGHPLKKW
jgi:hypothetical protein